MVGEIFLAVDKSDQDAKVQKDAENLHNELQAGASFANTARQFSQSPTAAQGGQIGLVYDGQLAPELNSALAGMKKGEVSKPIRSSGGYYILYLADRLEPLGTKIDNSAASAPDPNGSLPLARVLLPLSPEASAQDVENVTKVAGQILRGFNTCQQLADVPKQIPAALYSDLGVMKLKDLDPAIQKVLGESKPGEMAAPIRDAQGIEMIARCDERVEVRTAFTMPSREAIQNQLFDQQISALARRYLRDIKRDANVEVR
jgi:peptidyl-prolyl cis-trans isomerase SurA